MSGRHSEFCAEAFPRARILSRNRRHRLSWRSYAGGGIEPRYGRDLGMIFCVKARIGGVSSPNIMIIDAVKMASSLLLRGSAKRRWPKSASALVQLASQNARRAYLGLGEIDIDG